MKDVGLVILHGNDLEFLNLALNILEIEKSKNSEVRFLHLGKLVTNADTFSRKILKFAQIPSPEETVLSHLKSKSIIVIEGDKLRKTQFKDFNSVAIQNIEEASLSALISITADEYAGNKLKNRKLLGKLNDEGFNSYLAVFSYLKSHPEVTKVIVSNGRFPYQRGPLEAAHELNRETFSFERGSYESLLSNFASNVERVQKADNFWFQPFPRNSRVRKQNAILSLDLQSEEIFSDRVMNWFTDRQLSKGSNIYSAFWQDTHINKTQKKLATLFTSSIDEFAALGKNWKPTGWITQWQAFATIISSLLEDDFEVILRIHPNLLSKIGTTRRDSKKEIENLAKKFSKLRVIYPGEKINSYQLIKNADLVIVWNSTVGLEASWMGIPSVCLSPAAYDLVADIKSWQSVEDIDLNVLKQWKVDPSGALRYIAGDIALQGNSKFLLSQYGVDIAVYATGIGLFANKWAMRGTNRIKNLISLFLPVGVVIPLQAHIRKFKNEITHGRF